MRTNEADVAAAIAGLVAALHKPEPVSEPPVQTMFTIAEATEALRCSKSLVYSLTREGRLPGVRVGRRRLYAAKAIDAFLAEGGTAA